MDNDRSEPDQEQLWSDFFLPKFAPLVVELVAKDGIDLRSGIPRAAERLLCSLRDAGVGQEIDDLLKARCEKVPLIAAFLLPSLLANLLRTQNSLRGVFRSELDAMTSNFAHERYAITTYVKQATGRFHDREVAAIISAVTGRRYDEDAHRQWRRRHFKKIKSRFLERIISVTQEFVKEQVK
jgi:hypothetical protein